MFDFPLDLTTTPANYGQAATVQLFYWDNWMHDALYQFGFTEAAGNFQTDNFGRGGLGNDAVQADAQDGLSLNDGSHANNANMSTPPDGCAPRMQMYVFDGASPARDGSLDAQIVLHEYTHGLSTRLVGGGAGITVSDATAQMFDPDDPDRPVKAFLQEYEVLFGFGPEAITNATVQRDDVSPGNGARTVVWQQQVAGVPVFDALLIGHITSAGDALFLFAL